MFFAVAALFTSGFATMAPVYADNDDDDDKKNKSPFNRIFKFFKNLNAKLDEIIAILTNEQHGLEEIKREVRNIEDKVTNIENILENQQPPPTQSCQDLGFTDCFGTCKDTSTDEANCGTCGNVCNSGEVCNNGVCQFQCAGGTIQCGSSCVNLQSDPNHCGACNNICQSGESCVGGICQSTCTPSTEICDGVDNDCDTQIDEGFNVGDACGFGACAGGVVVCSTLTTTTCSSSGNASAEVCNNVDDDCDGTTDEDLGTQTCGVGACERTVSACVGGNVPACNPGFPSTERCFDGVDNDCDGQTDERVHIRCISAPLVGGVCEDQSDTCNSDQDCPVDTSHPNSCTP